MALTRKFLAAMGIEEDKSQQIIDAHMDTVNGLKDEVDKYKNDAKKLVDIQKELDKAKAKIKTLESDDTESPYKKQYEDLLAEKDTLQQEYDKFKADVDAKALLAKKSAAYRKLLKTAGVNEKRLDAIMKVTTLNDIELEEDGSIKGADDLTEKIKSEWADFIVQTQQTGAQTATPPDGNGDRSNGPSMATRLAEKHRNELYGKSKED